MSQTTSPPFVKRPPLAKRLVCGTRDGHRLHPSGYRDGRASCWCGDHRKDPRVSKTDFWLGDPVVVAYVAEQRRLMAEIVKRESEWHP